VAGLEQKQAALEGWIREWADREGRLKSECANLEQKGQGLAEMESKLREEVGQREKSERQAAELKQARAALEAELREWAEREGRLKSECARLEQKSQLMTESLRQTQALLAEQADGRTVAEQQAGELVKRLRALERDLAASQKREENLRANLDDGEGSDKPRLQLFRAGRKPLDLLSRFGQIARRGLMLSRKPFDFVSQRVVGLSRRSREPEQPNADSGAADHPIRANAGIAWRQDLAVRGARRRTKVKVPRIRAAGDGNKRVTGSNRGPTGRGKSQRSGRRGERE
jgi:hypothetical protein